MSSDVEDRDSQRADDPRVRRVDLKQYRELLISHRKLERVRDQPGWLRDRETDELFVFPAHSDASVTERV